MNTIKTTTNQFPLLYTSNDNAVNIHTVMDVKIGNESDFEGQYRGAVVPCMIIHISKGPITTNAVLVPLDNLTFVGYAVWADNTYWAPGLYCTNWTVVPDDATDDEKIEHFVKNPTEEYTVFSMHSVSKFTYTDPKAYVNSIVKRVWALRDINKPQASENRLAYLKTIVNNDIDRLVDMLTTDKNILLSEQAVSKKAKSDADAMGVLEQVLNGSLPLNKAIEKVTRMLSPSSEYGIAMLALGVSPAWMWCNVHLTSNTIILILSQPTADAAVEAFEYFCTELLSRVQNLLDVLIA